MTFLYFSMYSKHKGLIKQHIYLFFSSLFYLNNLVIVCEWGSDVLLFSEFITIVSILFYLFCYIAVYFLVISRCKEYRIFLISFSKFSYVLPDFTCARAIGILRSICLGLNIFNPFPCFALYLSSDAIKEYSLNNLIAAGLDS